MFSDIPPFSARKQEILEEAQALFSRKGYAAASMRDLADVLKIQPASLYSHYKSKEKMLWEIAIRCARDFHEAVIPVAQSDLSAEHKLAAMLKAHLEVIVRNINAAAIFFREWEHLQEPQRSEYAVSITTYEAAFASVIREGIAQGVFREVKAKFTTSVLLSSINWVHRWYRPEGQMSQEEIGADLAELLLRGLKR